MENFYKTVDYLAQARERVTEQFKEADVFDRYLQVLLSDGIELQDVYKDLLEKRSIDTASGVQLDIIGRIVGQERELEGAILLEFFGFLHNLSSGPFGDLFDSSKGAPFYSLGESKTGNIVLTDDLYRMFIRAKISKNTTRATPEDLMRFANFIFNASHSSVQAEGSAAFTLMIGRELSLLERGLLGYVRRTASYESMLLPKPVGVYVNYGQFDSNNFFAFAGVPNAQGFGALVFPTYDGKYKHDGTIDYSPDKWTVEGGGKLASLFRI